MAPPDRAGDAQGVSGPDMCAECAALRFDIYASKDGDHDKRILPTLPCKSNQASGDDASDTGQNDANDDANDTGQNDNNDDDDDDDMYHNLLPPTLRTTN